jgi:NADPH2:quinone reductase
MKGVRVHAPGGPEVLRFEPLPDPTPGPDQVVVRQEAIGVNFIDVYHRAGLYPRTYPFTPGMEGAGAVAAVGPGVTEFAAGDRVTFSGVGGSYAEQIAVPARQLVKIPAGVDATIAAAAMLQGTTAHFLVHSTYPLKTGEWALVHAAAGGVGLLLVQMARRLGAHVIATVGTEDKARLAREAGAEHVIIYTQQDFEAETKRITGGRGVQVVYDSVGKTTFDKSVNVLAPRGYMVLYGQSSGPVPPVDPQMLNTKGSLFLTRPTGGHYLATRDELLWRTGDVFKWIQSGELHVRIGHRFPLADAAEAHRALEGRQTTGKVLLIP